MSLDEKRGGGGAGTVTNLDWGVSLHEGTLESSELLYFGF